MTFTPTDRTDYKTATADTTIVVAQATPTITWASPVGIVYGTALSAAQLDATSNVAGTFAYSPAAGSLPNAGTRDAVGDLHPTDTTDYKTATADTTIVVAQATPMITWAAPASIVYGTACLRRSSMPRPTSRGPSFFRRRSARCWRRGRTPSR